MYFRRKTSGGRVYLQIAESRRVGGQVRHRVIATLGRRDALQASGQLERLVRSGARFAAQAMVVSAAQDDPSATVRREAKAVAVGDRRYILCRNQQEAERDAAARQAILANLERQLARGDKALVGNTGFRRFLKTEGDGHFVVDARKAEEDARFDGVFVLRTNTDLDPLAAMLRYKQLWTVEATFRTAKHLLATRPIFHKVDETIRLPGGKGLGPLPPTSRGAVFCSFLALVLKAELEQRIGRDGSWSEILADLDSLTETKIAHDDQRFLVRSSPRPAASLALRAAGVALPPTVRPLASD